MLGVKIFIVYSSRLLSFSLLLFINVGVFQIIVLRTTEALNQSQAQLKQTDATLTTTQMTLEERNKLLKSNENSKRCRMHAYY